MAPKTYTLTTAIDYVNAAPHIGHAYEKIATDVMARFQRLQGKPVFFLTGTDEHGTKVQKTAAGKAMSPKAYADELSQKFRECWSLLGVSYDHFIRTTDDAHRKVVQHLWTTLVNKGDIYKDSYTGAYCSGCESFLSERDLTEAGLCAIHQTKPEAVVEENYFFKLSAYKEKLREVINKPGFIQPAFRLTELNNILEDLQDISVSRPVSSVSWGIPVPGDATQSIYVWIDAVSNYLTGCGYLADNEAFERQWPAACQMIGKDILRFHALYWVAMLLAAELPLPRMIFAHGFININDAKISKSLGNVVAPQALLTRFELPNADALRYYLMTVSPFGQDGNFTENEFINKVNADLANNLGNLLNRTLNMTKKYCGGNVPQQERQSSIQINKTEENVSLRFEPVNEQDIAPITAAYNDYEFQRAAELVIHLVDRGNKLIHQCEPWTLYKQGKTEDVDKVLYTVLDVLRQVAILLGPITPLLGEAIWQQLGYPEGAYRNAKWKDVLNTPLPAGQAINLQGPILPRLEDELVGAAGKK